MGGQYRREDWAKGDLSGKGISFQDCCGYF